MINLNPDQWLLPETKEYLQGQDHKRPTEDEEQIESKLFFNQIKFFFFSSFSSTCYNKRTSVNIFFCLHYSIMIFFK